MSDQIACDGCGRSFVTDDAAGMLASIKGPCPTCGGAFRLAAHDVAHTPEKPVPAPRPGR